MKTQISHDPFARFTLYREKCQPNSKCAWCGQVAKFTYSTQSDGFGASPHTIAGEFCSIGCMRTFHGE